MKESESRQHILQQDELEQVLRDFFEKELPEEFREPPSLNEIPVAELEPHPTGQRKLIRSLAGLAAAVVAAAGFLLSVSNLQPRRDVEPVEPTVAVRKVDPSRSLAERVRKIADKVAAQPPLADVATFARTEPLERQIYDTADGPVEQRTDIVWTNVTYYEPQAAADVQWSLPALTIEIIPLTK